MLAGVAHHLGHRHVVCVLDATRDGKIECKQGQRNGNDSVREEHQPLGGRELDLALDLGCVTLCLRGSETLGATSVLGRSSSASCTVSSASATRSA